MRIRKKCTVCNHLLLMDNFNENLEYPDKKMRVCKMCEEKQEENNLTNKIEEVMATINLENTPHSFEKQNLVTNRDGSDTLICRHCGLKVKRSQLGSMVSVVGKADENKIKNCITKSEDYKFLIGQTIEVTRCTGSGQAFSNLTPKSIHTIIDAPANQELSWRGVWVEGVGEAVMLLNIEYKLIETIKTEIEMKAKKVVEVEVNVPEIKETLKEKRERQKAEKLAETVAPIVEEIATEVVEVAEVPAEVVPKVPKKVKEVVDVIVPIVEVEAVEAPIVALNEDGTVPEGYKQCKDCGGIFLLTDYHKDGSAKDGRIPRCKSCYLVTQLPENVAKRRAELTAKKEAKIAAKVEVEKAAKEKKVTKEKVVKEVVVTKEEVAKK